MKQSLQNKQVMWHKHFENCRESGLSQSAYCKQNNLVESQFYYWKKQLGITSIISESAAKQQKSSFVAVQVSQQNHQNIVIHLNNGISIEALATQCDEIIPMIKTLSAL